MTVISTMHVLQPPPFRWLRLPLLVATLGLSCVCIAVGAQGLDKYVPLGVRVPSDAHHPYFRSSKLERSIWAEARSTRSNIMFDMNGMCSQNSSALVRVTYFNALRHKGDYGRFDDDCFPPRFYITRLFHHTRFRLDPACL